MGGRRRCCCTREQGLGILTVVGSYLLEFSFGHSNTIGNLNTYLILHLGVTTSESIWFLGSTVVAQSIFTPVGELISQWVPYVGLLFATVVFCSGGTFLTMWSINNGMVAFLFTNSVFFGIGMGLSSTVTLKRTVAHYPQRSETIMRIEKQSRQAFVNFKNIKRNFKEAVKKPEIHIMNALNFLNVIPRMAIISTFKVYGKATGFDSISLVIVATLNGIFNCVGYVIARLACSKASFKAPLVLFLLLLTTLVGLFPLVKKIGLQSFMLYAFCVFGLHFAMAAVNVVIAVANNEAIAPLSDFGTNLAFSFCSASSAITFSVTTSYQAIDQHYDIFFWFVAGVGVLEIILALTLEDMACPLKLMRGRFLASRKLKNKELEGQAQAREEGTTS
ncbi:Major Facilitator Superfamily protein [Echinococcus multilocularis]|uniref:Major Facilitator Superfamily protein n=1 Tax=Echinococcus multilocularis TaxID=6211 RepID=A0A068Y9W9_ECHMU|nr:Major Facilitator Superfamily protein [Echinococcus multilocularis]